MRIRSGVSGLVAAVCICLAAPLSAAAQLEQVVSGLNSPVLVTHAGDGSDRLFIVEQSGTIKVLLPGKSAPETTPFLDITPKVLIVMGGGERGLLGLAFHPQYELNGRFFVYYTSVARASENIAAGDIVLAEYAVSADPNRASLAEQKLLTIPHSTFSNHNGGMLAFGADGFLYAGVGDGGGGNDPGNNGQNVNTLLGKILRIDVSTPGAHASPPDNPFFGSVPGRDEIYAYGFRNPWRFSFDRQTGQMWVADVGQGAREEVDTPIVKSGNYGWRVYEGSECTNNDPSLCNPVNYIFPVFDYTHSGGRCSITGGYAYRGGAGALTSGLYVYGDYCSGEIFTWNGTTQTVLFDTALNISSFGEDEAGELYVVGLGGTISKFVSTTCTASISPTRANFSAAAASGSVSITAPVGCPWTASTTDSWITITGGAGGNGSGVVSYNVAVYSGRPRNRNGSITIAGMNFQVKQTRQVAR